MPSVFDSQPLSSAYTGWPDGNHSPVSSTSTSLSSSFMSSAASDKLPVNSSQSDIHSSDHSVTSPPRHGGVYDQVLDAPRARSSSLAFPMGQSSSQPPPHHPATNGGATGLAAKGHALTNVAAATGSKLKRAFGQKKKTKSEDATKISGNPVNQTLNRPVLTSLAPVIIPEPSAPSPRTPKGTRLALQLASQALTGSKKPAPPLVEIPPPPPPKSLVVQDSKLQRIAPPPSSSDHGMTVPAAHMPQPSRHEDTVSSHGEAISAPATHPSNAQEIVDGTRERWRMSDSTVSNHTARPGGADNRASRPVSIADSLQSTHTVVPTNKRLSSLMTDADFTTPEEDVSSSNINDSGTIPSVSPASSIRNKNGRSLSLNLPSLQARSVSTPPTSSPNATELKHPSISLPSGQPYISPSFAGETPTLTRTAANGIMSRSSSGGGMQATGNHIRGRLAAWTGGSNTRIESSRERVTPTSAKHATPHNQIFRQTAVSITTGFSPAAGLAKRAVEKMGRAWGGLSSGSSTSGYSSSSSSTGPTSYSDHGLTRVPSNQSSTGGKYQARRTPDAPSGAWSVSSSMDSSSASDSEVLPTPTGPMLGKQTRQALRSRFGGLVFGRDLREAVRDTAVGVGVSDYRRASLDLSKIERKDGLDLVKLGVLETRFVPAIVARCAQHLLVWGIHEEGLFRVSGRPSHVSRLRVEFDTGADYDMQECSPGDLDPHAVSSIFKAFLREMPEPILTHALLPYFDAAVTHENAQATETQPILPKIGGRGPGLPSNPKSGGALPALRKPPSLSTLAMPSFSGVRPPSKNLINALKSLIARLPKENRDVLLTVIELIKATAGSYRETKMPLSNLLLVFCPSLNMNPPLLRILCENEEIWDSRPLNSPVLDIKRDDVVVDITSPPTQALKDAHQDSVEDSSSDEDEDEDEDDLGKFEDARDGTEDTPIVEPQGIVQSASTSQLLEPARNSPPSSESIADSSSPHPIPPSQPQADTSRPSIDSKRAQPRIRPMGPRRAHVPAVIFQDTVVLPPIDGKAPDTVPKVVDQSPVSEDSSSSQPGLGRSSSPLFSSSAESLPTPDGSSHMTPLGNGVSQPKNLAKGSECISFPSSDSAPATPLSPRQSMPSLSLPALLDRPGTSLGVAVSAPASPRRMKRPSLHLLFSKRSASPLIPSPRPVISSPYLHGAPDPNTPSSRQQYIIDTPIDSSSLRLDLGLDQEDDNKTNHDTPVLDKYPRAQGLGLGLPPTRPLQPAKMRDRSASEASFVSTTSSNHLGLLEDEEENHEDWTKSVLMLAADLESSWGDSAAK